MPVVLSILLGLLFGGAQDQWGTVEGIVRGAGSTPMSGALVKFVQSADTTPTPFSAEVTTDSNGRFVIANVPPGLYGYEITKEGYGYRSRPTPIVRVAPGQRVQIPEVSLSQPSTVRGRVLDADDKGLSFINVELLRLTVDDAGRRVWAVVKDRLRTNDQGEYQTTVLTSGDYYARAVMDSGPGRLVVYHPATTEGSKAALFIVPEGGDVVADIRVGSVLSEGGHLVSGKITLPPVDVASPFIILSLKPRDPNGPAEQSPIPSAQTSTRASEGVAEFEFRDVRPGNYELNAAASVDSRSYSAKVPVAVRDRDLERVEIALQPPVEIKGRLVIDGKMEGVHLMSRETAARSQLLRTINGVSAEGHSADVLLDLRCDGTSPSSRPLTPTIDDAGPSFSFRDIDPGPCKITAMLLRDGKPASQSLYVSDIRAGGRSVMESGFQVGLDAVDAMEIVVGMQGGSVEGRVTRNSGPDGPLTVLLMPEKSRRDNPSLFRTVSLAGAGPFRIEGLAPGEYQISAIPGVTNLNGVGYLLRSESRAVTVTVQKGKTSSGIEVPYLPPEK